MLRTIGWAQTYYSVNGKSGGRTPTFHTYAVYSFSTLKLIRVANTRPELEAYISQHKLIKVILVRFSWDNPESKGDSLHGNTRVENTPSTIKRCKHTDTRKGLTYNDLKGEILPSEWDII